MTDLTPEEQEKQIREQCPFCKIVAGNIPSKQVYSDDSVLAVLDIHPSVAGHSLVFAKEHHMLFTQMPVELYSHLAKRSAQLCGAVRKAMLAQGITLFIANGGAAGQQAYHSMMHIIPRDMSDGLDNFKIPKKAWQKTELDKLTAPLLQHITNRVVQAYRQAKKEIPKKPDKAPPGQKEKCLICDITTKKTFSNIVYEDELIIAHLPTEGCALGHIQIHPRRHISFPEDVTDAEAERLFITANIVSGVLFEALGLGGTNIIVNALPDSHLSVDVIPRKPDDGLDFSWQPDEISEEDLASAQAKINDEAFLIGYEKTKKKVIQMDEDEPTVIKPEESGVIYRHLKRLP